MKNRENLSSGSLVVPCGQTNRRTDMTKLRVAFRIFTNGPKNVGNEDLHTMATVKLARMRTKFRKSGINTFVQVPVHQSQIRSARRNTLTEWCSSLAVSVAANMHRNHHISKC